MPITPSPMGISSAAIEIRQEGGRTIRSRAGFSLVEILLVVVLMAGVAAMVVPAVAGLGLSASLKASGDKFTSLAQFARQNSITKNAMTALLVIGDAGTENDHRAFALYEVTPDEAGAPLTSASWRPLGNWELLPSGIVVDECTFVSGSAQNVVPPLPGITWRGEPVASYWQIVFLPNGNLLNNTPAYLRIVKGFRQAGKTTYTTGTTAEGQPSDYYDTTILPATGRVKVERP